MGRSTGAKPARAKRDEFDESLATLRRIRKEQPPDADVHLRPLLSHRSHYLASEAAVICGELQLSSLSADLVAQFHRVPDAYLRALTMVHLEPTGEGGYVDTAIPVRIAAAAALVETEGDDALFDVLPLLADSEAEVRAGAAKAVGALQTTSAAAALYVKLQAGDESADVLGACLAALLVVDKERFASLVSSYLSHEDDDLASLAALALAEARVPGALDLLRSAIETHTRAPRGRALFVAVAVLRGEESERYLLECLKSAPLHLAEHALYALAIHRDRSSVVDAAQKIVKARKSRELERMFTRSFDARSSARPNQ